MTSPALSGADVRHSDTIVLRRTFLVIALISIASVIENSFSAVDNMARIGLEHKFWETAFYEITSSFLILALFPFIVMCVRRAPPRSMPWSRLLLWHLGASVVFSVLHVLGMVVLRKIGFWIAADGPYIFDRHFPTEFIYEYRKDVITYALVAIGTYLALVASWQHQELTQAKADAKSSKRITLKCGGRTIWVSADTISWLKSAGNYVEVATGEATHLVRSTLKDIQDQIIAADIDAVRVHRSYVLNRARIAEVNVTPSGDLKIEMSDGTIIPGSRRMRGWFDGPSAGK